MIDSFLEITNCNVNKEIKTLTNKNNLYDEKLGKITSGLKTPDSRYKIICKTSKKDKNVYFSNFLERNDCKNIINSQIIDLFKYDGKICNEECIPFVNEGRDPFLHNNKDKTRVPKIFKLYNLKFIEGDILKCYVKNELGHNIGGKNLKGDFLRVFVRKNNTNGDWEILLLDPNHLVATEKYKKLYKRCKTYQYNIDSIKQTY